MPYVKENLSRFIENRGGSCVGLGFEGLARKPITRLASGSQI